MKKKLINLTFPGQQKGTVIVYIKSNDEETHAQLRLPLEELDNRPLNHSEV